MSTAFAPRVFLAGLFHETHTFLPALTTREECSLMGPAEILALTESSSPLEAALQTGRALGWDIEAGWDLRVIPGPMLVDEVVEEWWRLTAAELQKALQEGLDAIYLVLHGAMVCQSLDDPEGEFLARIRDLVGPDMPIFGVTDLHANFTPAIAAHSNGLITYRKNPHTDGAETGARAAHLLHKVLVEKLRASTYFGGTDIVWPPTGTATAAEPMASLEAMARRLEQQHPEFLAVNVHAGFAFADIEHCGVSFSVVSTGPAQEAQEALRELQAYAWAHRAAGCPPEKSFAEAWPEILAQLQGPGTGPVVVAEPSENIGGGAPGDGTGLLRDLIHFQVKNSAVCLWDPGAVDELCSHNIGDTVTLTVGGKAQEFAGAGPLPCSLQLVSLHGGHFDLEDPHSHMATVGGLEFEMGPSALTRLHLDSGGSILLLLTSNRTPPMDLGQWRSQGVNPEDLALVGVKAAVAHRQVYDPIARYCCTVSTPGPCGSNLRNLPFQKIRRPVFPLDEISASSAS